MPWFIYMIQCSDGSLYTGITTEPKRRLEEHKSGRGAKYFNAHKAINIRYLETAPNRSLASKREAAIKKLTAAKKQHLLSSSENELKDWPEYFKLD